MKNDLFLERGRNPLLLLQFLWTIIGLLLRPVTTLLSLVLVTKVKENWEERYLFRRRYKIMCCANLPQMIISRSMSDASYVKSTNVGSVGVVARNSSGEVIISSWDFLG